MSGLALIAYALARPTRIHRLVLVGTGASGRVFMTAPGALWNRSHPHFWRLASLGLLHILWPRRGPERLLNNFIRRQSFCDPSLAPLSTISFRDWLAPREGRTDWHGVAKRLDYTTRLGDLVAPTLIVGGRHDPQFPPTCSTELARRIPHSQLVWFERSGHFPFIEQPSDFWRVVRAFLDEPSSGADASS